MIPWCVLGGWTAPLGSVHSINLLMMEPIVGVLFGHLFFCQMEDAWDYEIKLVKVPTQSVQQADMEQCA
jgi:hypothetical protein